MYKGAKKQAGRRGWARTASCVVAGVALALFALASTNELARHQPDLAPAGRSMHRGSRQVADDGAGAAYPLGVSEVAQCKATFQAGLKPDTVGPTHAKH